MVVFHMDLDNTIIYSYRHEIGEDKLEAEWYNGRNISYITRETFEMLKKLKEKALLVPTTTRTMEQYQRINLQIGDIEYALVCNGGVLLIDGKEDAGWYRTSRELVDNCQAMLQKVSAVLEKDKRRIFEVRFIKELFVFTKCEEPEAVVRDLKKITDKALVEIFSNGSKVYAVPKALSKGAAVERFREYIGAGLVIAAGDSEFDLPMFEKADVGFAPMELARKYRLSPNTRILPDTRVYSEEVLSQALTVVG